jgi:erythronate-4-phosphate dehydrogenase
LEHQAGHAADKDRGGRILVKIVADENMPGLEPLVRWAELRRLPGRTLTHADVEDADVLLVRSVTAVNSRLLADSAVGFVGSATIGTDHVDLGWLQSQKIAFAHAPGCNARAVAEYVLQAALRWSQQRQESLAGKRIGLVGLGNVGSEVAMLFSALGCDVVAIDPLRQRDGDEAAHAAWASEEEVLACDIVSLHVPLTKRGDDATWHMLDAAKLSSLSAQQLLMSTCRGAVIDNDALLLRLAQPDAPTVVLDVWETEPQVPSALFRQVLLGTPHIAGYSVQGKLSGSAMVVAALYRWLEQSKIGLPEAGKAAQVRDQDGRIMAPADLWPHGIESEEGLLALLVGRYDLGLDHDHLQASLSERNPAEAFDRLRKQYAGRNEMSGVAVAGAVNAAYRPLLSCLGVTYSDVTYAES